MGLSGETGKELHGLSAFLNQGLCLRHQGVSRCGKRGISSLSEGEIHLVPVAKVVDLGTRKMGIAA